MHRSHIPSIRQHAVQTAVFSLALAGNLALSPLAVWAGESTAGLAEKEIQRRAVIIEEQVVLFPEAEKLLRKGETAAALKIYEDAFNALPDIPMAQEARTVALDGYIRAGLTRSKELMDGGDYPAASALLTKLDNPKIAQGNRKVASLKRRLADVDRYPPALTPQHIENVAQVKKLLFLANSQRETGQYDKAISTYEDVLRRDPYNTAAREGMEKVEQAKAGYYETARNHGRSKMLNDVNATWENQVPLRASNISGLFGGQADAAAVARIKGSREVIQQKLRDLKIAQIDFSGAALEEVVEYLRLRSRDLDPQGKGIDFVLRTPAETQSRLISLSLKDVPIEEVLRYVCDMAGLTFRVEEYAVMLLSAADDSGVIISKSYRVPPDFISSAPMGNAAPTASADPFASTTAPTGGIQIRRMGAQEFLQSYGVSFPEGTSANYSPTTNMLVVRNTAKGLEIVDMLVEQAFGRSPKQVVIEVKLLEISNNRLTELGYDWLLDDFGTIGNKVGLAGGTAGNAQDANSYLTQNFPFQKPTSPTTTTAVGENPITAGLRSSADLNKNSIDAILVGTRESVSNRSPGAFAVSGVLTDPQFQGVIRALDQKKGVDLTAQPSVVTRSGQKATLEITRELIYPTEFDPPQIPTNIGANNNDDILIDPITGLPILGTLPSIPVTPTTPTTFTMRKTGVVLEVEPVISEDGRTVDLSITPEFTDFAGFVNYGSPIRSLNNGDFQELTPNLIYQPVFDTKKIVTAVKVWDGATVVLGGLVADREEVINDKVPILGDIPFIGRFFKSDAKQRISRQTVFFVKVRVVDPSGARINPDAND